MTQPEQESEVDRMAWEDALSDPRTKAALDEGLKDLAEGRVGPFKKRVDKGTDAQAPHEVFGEEVARETTDPTSQEE